MASAQGIRMKSPAHPGGFVRTEVIEPLHLSVTDAARVLGITRAALSSFLNQRSHLSAEMAIRLEKAFGVPMETLMRMQNSFDIARARKREGAIEVARYVAKGQTTPHPAMPQRRARPRSRPGPPRQIRSAGAGPGRQ